MQLSIRFNHISVGNLSIRVLEDQAGANQLLPVALVDIIRSAETSMGMR